MASAGKARTVILACSVAAVTVLGTLYGADLKSSRDVVKKKREAPADEILAQLNASRKGLIAQKTDLERKIAELESKRGSVTKA
ncbi:MAG: hypothetical protein Q9168_002845 [Polycauliona sp. 1 TL-2023]